MSTATPPVRSTKVSETETLIDQRVEEARRALWWSEATRTFLVAVIAAMVAVLAWLIVDHWIYSPGPLARSVCLIGLVTAIAVYLYRRGWPLIRSKVTAEYAAWSLEQDHPEYRQQLTSYVTLRGDDGQRGLRARVVKLLGARAASLLTTNNELPREARGTFGWWIAAAGLLAVLAAYFLFSPKSSIASAGRLVAPFAAIEPARRVEIRDVQPGNAEALAGREVPISAEITGLRQAEPVWCRWTSSGKPQAIELTYDENTDRYAGGLALDHAASGQVRYTVEAGDDIAGPFELLVDNVPVVAVQRVRYEPPAYTQRNQHSSSSPSITAIDGTKIRLTATTNRPVERAEIQFNPKRVGETVRSTGGRRKMQIGDDGRTLTADLVLRSTRGSAVTVEPENYRIRVWDASGRENPDPIVYPIRVIADLPPEVAIVVPKKSPVEVPVTAQQMIEVHAMDADFQLDRVTLEIERGIDTLDTPLIWVNRDGQSGRGNQVSEFRFRPDDYQLRVGDVVRIKAIAVDNRQIPDDAAVKPNRRETDPVELRIVEPDNNLSDDPTANDGLSRPDDRPASDVQQPPQQDSSQSGQQGQGGQSAGGESAEQQSAGEQSSGGQSSGEQGSGEQNAGQQDADPSQSNPAQPEQGEAGEQASGEQASEQQASEQREPAGEQQPGEGSNPDQPLGDPSGGTQTGAQQPPGDQTGQNGPSGESAGGQQSATPEGGSEQTPSDQQPAGGNQSGQSPNQGESGDSSAPPKHDGEAFERIKDYIEKQKQKPSQQPSRQEDPSQQGEQAQGEQAQGKQAQGKQAQGEQAQGEQAQGEQAQGEQAQGEQAQGEQAQGEQAQGEQAQGEQAQGEQAQGEQAQGEQTQGEQAQGEQAQGEQAQGEQAQGEQAQGEQAQGSESTENQSGDRQKNSEQSPSAESSSNADSQSDSSPGQEAQSGQRGDAFGQSSDGQNRRDGSDGESNSNASPSNSSSPDGSGTGTSAGQDGGEGEPPPPPDLEYAKEATDMVLDYLEETRDQVDQDLLDDLNWSKDDLQRFQQRWQKVREMESPRPDAKPNRELADALRSLGLRPDQSPRQMAPQSGDGLQNLRDSGNRRKAPPAFRDAFDAFRRRGQ
jgi:hypothetical protein